jgi:hypothetical protein
MLTPGGVCFGSQRDFDTARTHRRAVVVAEAVEAVDVPVVPVAVARRGH